MYKKQVKLKNGKIVEGDFFEKEDLITLKNVFLGWLKINKETKSLNGRGINLPDVFTESLFCLLFDCIRTNDTAKSYDCVRISDGAGIQIKSTTILEDCTSFGPKSTWDELYFMDFAPNGRVDGKIDIYKIDRCLDNIKVNRTQTFKEQQKEGRRPRFSIKKEIIEKDNLKPVKTINLLEE